MVQASREQERFGKEFLGAISRWIAEWLAPDDVFYDDQLKLWAGMNCEPADVFDEADLADWAERNGYVKVE